MKSKALIKRMNAILSDFNQDIVCAYIFGSVARGEDRGSSDVDIAILRRKTSILTLDDLGFDLIGKLEREIGRRIDLVILNQSPVDLIHRILRDGVLIYETDPSGRIAFETAARSKYFDILPYLNDYRQATSKVGS